jgi:hypothetical protein
MAALTLGATIVAVILWGETAREALYKLLGIRTECDIGRSTMVKVLGILVLMVLMIAQDPEVRVFLLFVDSLSVDLFILLLAVQGRECLWLLYGAIILPAARHLANVGPFPLPLPSRWFFSQHPLWAAYSIAKLMYVGSKIALLAALVVTAATSTVTCPAGKVLSATVLAKRQRSGNVVIKRGAAMMLLE